MADESPRFTTILLYGPSGCGKTLFANALSAEARAEDPYWTSVTLVASGILQDPVANVEDVFDGIERFEIAGLLIEDYDELLNNLRSTPPAHQLLLERIRRVGGKVLIVATARYPEILADRDLDVFQDVWPFLYPDEDERLDILKVHTREVRLEPSISLEMVAKSTQWWSGSELHDLIERSKSPNDLITFETLAESLEAV